MKTPHKIPLNLTLEELQNLVQICIAMPEFTDIRQCYRTISCVVYTVREFGFKHMQKLIFPKPKYRIQLQQSELNALNVLATEQDITWLSLKLSPHLKQIINPLYK